MTARCTHCNDSGTVAHSVYFPCSYVGPGPVPEDARGVYEAKCNECPPAERPIITQHVYPPIPIRSFDWWAARDGYEPGEPIGWGATEQAAIDDLLLEEGER